MVKVKNLFKVDMVRGNILRSLIIFSIPIFISGIFQQLYNTVDTVIVGHTLGESALAAVGASGAIYELIIGCAMGITNGLGVVCARSYGSGDKALLRRSVAGSIVIVAVVAAVMTGTGRLVLEDFLSVLNTPAEIMADAVSYTKIIITFLLVTMCYNLCSGILRAIGDSLMPLVFLIASSLCNIGLDFLFILGFDMGIRGAAVATVVSQGISVLLISAYIIKKVRYIVPRKADWKFEKEMYGELFSQGMAQGMMSCIVSAGSAVLQSGINGLGYMVIAGHTAARKTYICGLMFFSAINGAVMTFVSQNKGAIAGGVIDKHEGLQRIKKGVKSCYAYGAAATVILMIFIIPFAPKLIAFMSGSDNQIILTNGTRYLRFVAPCYFMLTVLNTTRCSLQAIGQKLLPVFSSVIELVGKIIFMALLIPRFGYNAVIVCEPIIWAFMLMELLPSFWKNSFFKD